MPGGGGVGGGGGGGGEGVITELEPLPYVKNECKVNMLIENCLRSSVVFSQNVPRSPLPLHSMF